jgi:hypothetical protein
MLVRSIGVSKWQRAYLFMKRNSCKEVIVEEKYNYEENEDDLDEQVLKSLWVYAILVIDEVAVMVTCLLDQVYAWCSRQMVLDYIRKNPNLWLAEDKTTLHSLPIRRQEHLIDLLERAALARAPVAPDQEGPRD